MNLDFGILWIEDSFSSEEETMLRRRVLDAGFIPRVTTIPNGVGLEKLAEENARFHQFDIILLDYRLANEDGSVLAPKIRKLFPSTTILFYSGSVTEDELRSLIAGNRVEGVYCSARDHQRFIQRTGELIAQTARSLDRLSGMRGLAMRVVAECDELMKKSVLMMCERDANCADLVGKLDHDVNSFLDELREDYASASKEDISIRLKTRAVDSTKLFKHFRRLTQAVTRNPNSFGLNPDQVERLRALRSNGAQYHVEVIQRRNVLGHAFETRGEAGWILTGNDLIQASDFPEMRRSFAGHIDIIREICKILHPTEA